MFVSRRTTTQCATYLGARWTIISARDTDSHISADDHTMSRQSSTTSISDIIQPRVPSSSIPDVSVQTASSSASSFTRSRTKSFDSELRIPMTLMNNLLHRRDLEHRDALHRGPKQQSRAVVLVINRYCPCNQVHRYRPQQVHRRSCVLRINMVRNTVNPMLPLY